MDEFKFDILKVYSKKYKCITAFEETKYADKHNVADRKALDSFEHKQMVSCFNTTGKLHKYGNRHSRD